MALQTSGAISLGDIHVEAEGSPYAGTGESSLNDANIRGLTAASGYTINSTSGTQISIGDFYGASAFTATHTLTQGSHTYQGNVYNGKFATVTGSVSPTTYSGYTIYTLARFDLYSGGDGIWFYLSGTVAVDIFDTLEFEATDGTIVSLDRSDATSSQVGTSYRYWTWDYIDFDTGHFTKMQSTFDGSGDIDVRIS